MFEWAYSGVDASVPGNGGPECANFSSLGRRFIETILVLTLSLSMIAWSYKNLSIPEGCSYVRKDRGGKRVLLIMMSLIWGIEIGFKLASQTVIYLLNPCHVTTAIQIYLLGAPPSKKVTCLFRIHLNFLNGAVLAFLFPVTESRILPFETSIYWIQHSMMMVVPYYLLRLGGVYNVEKISDFSWSFLSYGMNLTYHFIILQIFAIPSQVNLNHILCPTLLDPFYGQYYRIAAVAHQALLCPLVSKLYCIVSAFFLTKFGPTKVKKELGSDVTLSSLRHGVVTSAGKHLETSFNQNQEHGLKDQVKNGHTHRE